MNFINRLNDMLDAADSAEEADKSERTGTADDLTGEPSIAANFPDREKMKQQAGAALGGLFSSVKQVGSSLKHFVDEQKKDLTAAAYIEGAPEIDDADPAAEETIDKPEQLTEIEDDFFDSITNVDEAPPLTNTHRVPPNPHDTPARSAPLTAIAASSKPSNEMQRKIANKGSGSNTSSPYSDPSGLSAGTEDSYVIPAPPHDPSGDGVPAPAQHQQLLQQEISSLKKQLAEGIARNESLTQKLEYALQTSQNLEQELSSAKEAQFAAAADLEAAQAALDSKNSEIERLNSNAVAAAAATQLDVPSAAEQRPAQQDLEQMRAQLLELRVDRDRLKGKSLADSEELAAALARIDLLEQEKAAKMDSSRYVARETMEQVAADLKKALQNLDQANAEKADLVSTRRQTEGQVAGLKEQLRAMEESRHAQHQRMVSRVELAESERDHALHAQESLRQEIEALRAELTPDLTAIESDDGSTSNRVVIANLERDLETARRDLAGLSDQSTEISRLTAENSQLSSEVDAFKAAMSEQSAVEAENERLKAALVDAESCVQKLSETKENEQNELRRLLDEASAEKARLTGSITTEADELRTSLLSREQELQAALSASDHAAHEAASKDEEIAALKQKVENLTRERLEAEDHARNGEFSAALKAQLAVTEKELSEANLNLSAVSVERDESISRVVQLEGQLEALGLEKSQQMAELMASSEKELQDQITSIREQFEAELAAARQQASTASTEGIDAARKEMEAELGSILQQKDADLHQAKTSEAALRREFQSEAAKVVRLEAELEEMRAGGEQQDDEVTTLREQVTLLLGTEAGLRAEVNSLEERVQAAEMKAIAMEDLGERAREENRQLSEQLGSMQLQASRVRDETSSDARSKEEELRALIQAEVLAKHQEELHVSVEKHREELSSLQTQIDVLQQHASSQNASYESQIADLKKRLEKAQLASVAPPPPPPPPGMTASATVGLHVIPQMSETNLQGRVEKLTLDMTARETAHREQVELLRSQLEAKDRKIETLSCEVSTLKMSKASVSRDVEAGHSTPDGSTASPGGSGASMGRAFGHPVVADIDRGARQIVRTLYRSPNARMVCVGYLMLLHVWVFFVLQWSLQ